MKYQKRCDQSWAVRHRTTHRALSPSSPLRIQLLGAVVGVGSNGSAAFGVIQTFCIIHLFLRTLLRPILCLSFIFAVWKYLPDGGDFERLG